MSDAWRDPQTDPRPGDVVRSAAGGTYHVFAVTSESVGYSCREKDGSYEAYRVAVGLWRDVYVRPLYVVWTEGAQVWGEPSRPYRVSP